MFKPTFSIVVPVYKNATSLPRLIAELSILSAELQGNLEVVFVVDGSPDDSLQVLLDNLMINEFSVAVLELSRNFGSFSAIREGLAYANGEYIAVMAADLQEPPSLIKDFFDALTKGEVDIAVGNRTHRSDPFFSRLVSSIYWWTYRRTIHPDIPRGGVDVFACTRAVAQQVTALPESNTSLIGLMYWVGYRKVTIPYSRQARADGKSAWTLGRKLRYFTDSIYSFTGFPIVILQSLGIIGLIVSLSLGIAVTLGWATGAITEPGYTPLMLVITGSTSALLFAIGIVGTYVWRTYENSKQRPLALVRNVYASDDNNGSQ